MRASLAASYSLFFACATLVLLPKPAAVVARPLSRRLDVSSAATCMQTCITGIPDDVRGQCDPTDVKCLCGLSVYVDLVSECGATACRGQNVSPSSVLDWARSYCSSHGATLAPISPSLSTSIFGTTPTATATPVSAQQAGVTAGGVDGTISPSVAPSFSVTILAPTGAPSTEPASHPDASSRGPIPSPYPFSSSFEPVGSSATLIPASPGSASTQEDKSGVTGTESSGQRNSAANSLPASARSLVMAGALALASLVGGAMLAL